MGIRKIDKTLLDEKLSAEIDGKLSSEDPVDWSKIINKPQSTGTVISNSAPEDKTVLWIDTTN